MTNPTDPLFNVVWMVAQFVPPGHGAYVEVPSPFGPVPVTLWRDDSYSTTADPLPGRKRSRLEGAAASSLAPAPVSPAVAPQPAPRGASGPMPKVSALPHRPAQGMGLRQAHKRKKSTARADGTRYRSPATRRRSARRAAVFRREKEAARRAVGQPQPTPSYSQGNGDYMDTDTDQACPVAADAGSVLSA